MKLSALIESLSKASQDHGDLDVYVGFSNLGNEGRIEAELAEVEVEHYDSATPADKALMLWGVPDGFALPATDDSAAAFQSAREYAVQAGPELLRLALKHMHLTRDQDSDGDALMDLWQGWYVSLGLNTTLQLADLKATPAEVQL
jgi:hypothetical protein